jgi:phytoene desaturase
MSKVVIIGAGMGGLAAAARLSRLGHDVAIFEQSDHTGGKLRTWRQDGFAFDTGPSLLTLPAVYRDLFLKTGIALEREVDLQPVERAFRYAFTDGSQAVLPGADPTKCAAALADAFGNAAGADWRALMARAGAMWQATREPFLQSPIDGWRTIAALTRRPGDIATIAPFSSLRALGRRTLRDPRLRMILDRYATYTGSDPRHAPAVLATIAYVEQTFGAWHIGGGLGQLAEALTRRCVDRGVQINLASPVQQLRLVHGRVAGVLLEDGRSIDADIVVANADARLVYSQLVRTSRTARLGRMLRRRSESLAGFVILVAVRGRTPDLAHHNLWFPKDYDAEFNDIFGSSPRPVHDPTIYACVPDDPAMRPDEDHESWFILVNAPCHGVINWNEEGLAESYADHVLARLAERGMDLRHRMLWRRVQTPADLEQQTWSPGGAIYGTSSNGARAAFTRPANRSPIPGLYLVGGSAHPGGGLPLVGMGAEIVADLIGPAGQVPGRDRPRASRSND